MTARRAISYIRMSTEVQLKGHSLERQLALTRTYAKEKGFELVEDLRDIAKSAYSGKNTKEGQLGEFLKGIEDGTVDKDCVLLVESLDRLSRQNPMKAFRQFCQIVEYGIEIHTISDRQIYTVSVILSPPRIV
jgi:DNA invertase Pin-like site-specific DNA recombinase